ncbi:hypothetical protein T4A_8251 [Trichinella pseudospiralis]|uniref:Uncharacterized protein n=1 Tax=Trichinella pseudospiralis TaxID=6337 RepID=A0A0V1F249_TRIPS|nr:hypothetical protein T4A_8251 [Trichinella pseudospiralis]KRY92683.1 hypothetical protein T4D_10309 [Trichinella pseudospiralis]
MPSLKREANTGPSPNSEGRANSLAEETDEPPRGSGSLQSKWPMGRVIEAFCTERSEWCGLKLSGACSPDWYANCA